MSDEYMRYENPGWVFYEKGIILQQAFLPGDRVGKFMTFIDGPVLESMQNLIVEAIVTGATPLVKHSHPDAVKLDPDGVTKSAIVWYATDEAECLQRLVRFLIDHELLPRTKSGRLSNLTFKYNADVLTDGLAEIKLSDVVNLKTGAFVVETL